MFFSLYTVYNAQESTSTFHSWNVQSVSVTLWVVHSVHRHYHSCLPVLTFSSSFVHFSIPALYLTKGTVWEFIALIVFPPFNFDDVSCLTLLYYFFWISSFISVCIMSLASKTPKYLQPLSDSSSGITSPDEISIPPTLTSFPAFIVTCAHLLIPNYIAISFEKILTVFVSLSASFSLFP